MRRLPAVRARVLGGLGLGLLVCALAVGACGGIIAPDLFVVRRSGSTAQARLTVLVNEEGMARCNDGRPRRVSDSQLIQARTIQEDLHDYAKRHEELAPRRGSVLAYTVRDQDGSVAFSDNSAHQPRVFRALAAWTLAVAERVCKLPQGGA